MHRQISSLLLTVALFMVLALPSFAQLQGKVVKIADGDTFTILTSDNKQVKIRLHGIDCPEKAQPFGTKAKQFTSELVFGKTIKAQIKDTDRYNRVIAIVTVGNRTVNEELLMSGFAWHYKKYDNSPWYAQLEEAARAARFGLWEDHNPIPPWEWRKNK
jgi:Micrococcal nuclease (thermonuclease) homologs